MRKILAIIISVIFIVSLAACSQDASKTDIKEPKFKGRSTPSNYSTRTPDKLTVYQNIDGHPTIVKLCIEGLAFRTVSTTHSGLATPAVERVPEWDASCKA